MAGYKAGIVLLIALSGCGGQDVYREPYTQGDRVVRDHTIYREGAMEGYGYDYCEDCGREVPVSTIIEIGDGEKWICFTCYSTQQEMAVVNQ